MGEVAENIGGGHEEPQGKLLRTVYAFKALMMALKGGGVWAALTVLLLTCGWLAWELRAANNRIVEILLAIKMAPPPAEEPRHRPPSDMPGEEPFDPREVLARYHKMYRPQVEQRMPFRRELAEN